MEFVVNEDSDVDKYLELIAGEEQVSEELKLINANTYIFKYMLNFLPTV